MSAEPFDCRTCGACCISSFGERPGYVFLAPDDVIRLGRIGLPLVPFGNDTLLGTVAYEGLGGERICAAFGGVVGGRCGCSIYLDRPRPCRNFKPGSVGCRMARHEAGLGEKPEELTNCLKAMAALQEQEEANGPSPASPGPGAS
jgi:Fe-S-cluster containining protein